VPRPAEPARQTIRSRARRDLLSDAVVG